MAYQIKQIDNSQEIEKFIVDGFTNYALEAVGHHGAISDFLFSAVDNDVLIGVIQCRILWGALHIRRLFIDRSLRKRGIGTALIQKAEEYAEKKGATFSLVETMDFQAAGFYKKMGYYIEYSRKGFIHGRVQHCLRKDFSKKSVHP